MAESQIELARGAWRPRPKGLLRNAGDAVWRALRLGWLLFSLGAVYMYLWVRKHLLRRPMPAKRRMKIHHWSAMRFRKTAERLKGAMIKVGQLLSARADVFPRVVIEELGLLQDRVAPTDFAYIAHELEAELGKPLEEVFERLDEKALSAASFGQVHRGVLLDGREVAIKIHHPDVVRNLKIDLFLFRIANRTLNLFLRKMNIKSIYDELNVALRLELDYGREGRNSARIRKNMLEMREVVIPEVYPEYSTGRVICMEYVPGIKIIDFAAAKEHGVSRSVLLDMVLRAYTKMVYVDGFFQSDPHPGNLFFQPGPPLRLVIVDFGQVKDMPQSFHNLILEGIFSYAAKDVEKFTAVGVKIGLIKERDLPTFRPVVEEFFKKYYHLTPKEAAKLDFPKIRDDLLDIVNRTEGLTLPTDLILFGRTLGLLYGLGVQLDPRANIWEVAKPHIMELVLGRPPSSPTSSEAGGEKSSEGGPPPSPAPTE